MAFPELRAIFGGAAYVPDVAVYRWERIPRTSEGEVADDFMEPPDIALEIVSPKQSVTRLVRKSVWYVENGVRVALVVDPEDRTVLVFRPGMSPRSVQGDSRVDLDDVLPGFQFSADELFASLKI
jgi:Uma2 family endonuclease